jgi:hypothetical protein
MSTPLARVAPLDRPRMSTTLGRVVPKDRYSTARPRLSPSAPTTAGTSCPCHTPTASVTARVVLLRLSPAFPPPSPSSPASLKIL